MSSAASATSAASLYTVLITGASRGLGLEFVRQYARRPHHRIIATCRSPSTANALHQLVNQSPPGVISIVPLDTSDQASIHAALHAVQHSLTPPLSALHLLINNAGIATPDHPDDTPSNTTKNDMLTVYTTNVVGPLLVTQAFLPLLRTYQPSTTSVPRPPIVVNLSSNLGSIASNTFGGITAYRCSKSALNQLTRTFAFDVPHVLFLAMAPGWVQTDMGSAHGRTPPVKVDDSVSGMITTIEQRTLQDSGHFWNFTNERLPY